MLKKTNEMDIKIGKKIKEIREIRGPSRGMLAEALQTTHQQIQKYEEGSNRMSCGKLYEVTKYLEVPINVFHKDGEIRKYVGAYTHLENAQSNAEFIRKINLVKDNYIRGLIFGFLEYMVTTTQCKTSYTENNADTKIF